MKSNIQTLESVISAAASVLSQLWLILENIYHKTTVNQVILPAARVYVAVKLSSLYII